MPPHFGGYTPLFVDSGKRHGGFNMSREEMIQAVSDTLRKMYYEDIDFFYGFLIQYASKKGVRV